MRLRWREADYRDFDRFKPVQPIVAQRFGPPNCDPDYFILQFLDDTQPGGGMWVDVTEDS